MALECYLKLKDIPGECLDAAFSSKKVIQLTRCSFQGEALPDPERQKIGGTSGGGFMSDDDDAGLAEGMQWLFGGEESQHSSGSEKWPFTISAAKLLDVASPKLFEKYCQYANLAKDETKDAAGTLIPAGKMWARKLGGGKPVVFMEWQLKEIQVTSLSWVQLSDGNMEESLTLRFRSFIMNYSPQDNTGKLGTPIPSGWNLQTNKDDAPAVKDSEL